MSIVGRIFLSYLMIATAVAGVGYLLTLPWF